MNNAKQSFQDLLAAADRLVFPWRIALLITNALWAAVLAAMLNNRRGR